MITMPPVDSKIYRLLLTVLLAVSAPSCSGRKAADQWKTPKLTVVISIDQMRADYLTRFESQFTGGLARLSEQGRLFTETHHDHAITATAAGHASISTGTYPARSGIINNAWWDRETWRSVYAVEDTVRVIGAPNADGSSPRLLQRTALGDWLKDASAESKVFSVALKDRAAVLMGGQHPDAAYWWYDAGGRFVSSSHYLETYPGWVNEFNASGRADAWFESGWTRLSPESEYSLSREDAFASEADGRNTTFPHLSYGDAPGVDYYTQLREMPFGDDLAFQFAEQLLINEEMGQDDAPDLLFVGGSAGDGVGHTYGPFSQEVQDYYLRMDLTIGRLLRLLDRRIGEGNYLVVLTGDHGALPLPEELKRRGVDAGRINPRPLLDSLLQLSRSLSGIENLRGAITSDLYFQWPDSAVSPVSPADVRIQLADIARSFYGIEDAYTFDELNDPNTPDRPFLDQYRHSFTSERGADLMFRYKENYLALSQRTGTTHLSPYSYDTHVPLVFLSARLPASVHASHVKTVDIAPTIARLIGIPAPGDLDGHVLTGALPDLPPEFITRTSPAR